MFGDPEAFVAELFGALRGVVVKRSASAAFAPSAIGLLSSNESE